ncbi:hypothetical protein OK074_4304 [Actinobacteria bacterium OK074]|nr:hypothetical protein OK074_4304 [Actinobacteria bacterium OK074]
MAPEMAAPAWMHTQISAEQYDSWSEEQCAGIEIADGTVVVSPSASKRHNRPALILANALDAAAGPDWNADTGFDVRLQDVPLTNRRPDVTVYRAETIDLTPTRVEQAATGVPIVCTYVLDPATKAYRDGEMFTGVIKAAAPSSVTVGLGAM